jgi:hypothetical protein
MALIYAIEDERHDERIGEYSNLPAAVAELERLKDVAWDVSPNRSPCENWRKCGRLYEIVEYDLSETPRKQMRRIPALEVSRTAVQWLMA